MLNDFLKEVVVIVVGKQAEPIAELLNTKKHVNEFNIAKKLDITINQTRNILYKLSDYGLVSSIRKKDKKKGWYTYFWRIEILKSLEFLKSILTNKMEEINSQLSLRSNSGFYECKRCNLEFNEVDALNMEFTCNECGDVFTSKDNTKDLKDLNRIKDKFVKKIELVEVEIGKENQSLEKIREKELKKELKEKEKKKAEKAAARKKIASSSASLKAKNSDEKKKVVKKKTTKKVAVKEKVVKKKTTKKKISKK